MSSAKSKDHDDYGIEIIINAYTKMDQMCKGIRQRRPLNYRSVTFKNMCVSRIRILYVVSGVYKLILLSGSLGRTQAI